MSNQYDQMAVRLTYGVQGYYWKVTAVDGSLPDDDDFDW